MPSPSTFFSGMTSDHDRLHLWLHNPENQKDLVKYVLSADLQRKNNGIFKITNKETEVGVYGYNGYHHGTIDCVLHVIACSADDDNHDDEYVIICDLKPNLYSISAIMGQLGMYREKYEFEPEDNKRLAVITFDPNIEYDGLLLDRGIHIYRVQTPEEKRQRKMALERLGEIYIRTRKRQ